MPTEYVPSIKYKIRPRSKPKISKEDMVLIANRLSRQNGRCVSYGDVQCAMDTGRLTVAQAKQLAAEEREERKR